MTKSIPLYADNVVGQDVDPGRWQGVRIMNTGSSVIWNLRASAWLQRGTTPGSFQIKTPPRLARASGGSPLPWAPRLWAMQVLCDPSGRAQRGRDW